MNRLKLIGNKELIYLSSPLIFGVFLYFMTVDFLKDFVMNYWKLSPYPPPRIIVNIPKTIDNSVEIEEIKGIITVKPYEVTTRTVAPKRENPLKYKISFIYIGNSKYVIINGKLLTEGENISQDEKIIKIYQDGVLLKGKWGERWIRFLR